MSVTHMDVLETARRLSISGIVDVDPCESDLRSVASRAYYATLHATNDSIPPDLQPSNSDKDGKSSHQVIIDAVTQWSKSVRPGRSEARIVARNLPKLKHLRKKADYLLKVDFTLQEASSALHTATITIASAVRAGEQARLELTA